MDNSASEHDLAEELKATRVRVQDLEMQIEDLSERISNIASQLGKLTKVVKNVMAEGFSQTAPNGSAATVELNSANEAARQPAAEDEQLEIPRELLQAIRLVTEHRSEEAQKLVTSLPRETLAEYPGIVAMVAAAVRIRRGEMDIARTALNKAREMIRDQRLLKVVKFLEKQL